MKIRDKLLLGFGLYILISLIFGSFAYRSLRMISTKLVLVETADDITNAVLEVRRHEKNYLLYRDKKNLADIQKQLILLKESIEHIKAEIIEEITSSKYQMMKQTIAEYEEDIAIIAKSLEAQDELAQNIRTEGRRIVSALAGADSEVFLELRRYEKNIMLYKDQESYEEFKKTVDAADLANSSQVREYVMLIAKYHDLQNEVKISEDRMRFAARNIQEFTQDLAKKERSDIAMTIKMSIRLQVLALLLVVVLGIIINIKLATSIATPIRTIEKITKKIALGDFSESIEVKGKDELSSLEASFNLMEEKLQNALWSLEHTIEKLREKQAQLVEAEKLASVGMLAAGIAHEINNPLTSVLTFSNLILEQCPKDSPWCDKLRIMVRETERARNIVRQLLNFGREANIKPVKININRPVEEIMDSLVAQEAFKGIELSVGLGEDLPDVYADPAQIGQVVLNLALNAIHAITPPGKIEVSTRAADKAVEIIFRDTGSGIAPEHMGKIFDPFFSTKGATKGTGLGLAVSYGIIKKHGGDIEVASIPGQGTTFTVRVPVHG
jgi:signal transduction histidine kinase